MKKLAAAGIGIVLCTQLMACSFMETMSASKNKEETWIAEGAELISDDVRSGEFVIDGEVYTFPSNLSDWIDKGWHISNIYENKDTFELEPWVESSSFELYNDNEQYVEMMVLNMSEEDAKLEECTVSYLRLSLAGNKFQVVLPKGVTGHNKPDEVYEKYGEPDEKDDSESEFVKCYYLFEDKEDWKCYVELGIFDNNYTIDPLSSVVYALTEDNWADIESEEGCLGYFDGLLKTSFYGDYAEYVAGKYSSEEDAQLLYELQTMYYADTLMQYFYIDSQYVEDEVFEKYAKLAETILSKAKWELENVDYFGKTLSGTLKFTLYPIDFLDLIGEDASAVYTEFSSKYDTSKTDYSEEELTAMFTEYADMMYTAICGKVDGIGNTEAVEKEYDIDFNEDGIESDDWDEIFFILMGFEES